VGFRGTGKTVLTTKFVEGSFIERHEATIEGTYRKMIRFRRIHFSTEIVDTAGMVSLAFLSITITRVICLVDTS
jgi:GTPase SAR1 family protein